MERKKGLDFVRAVSAIGIIAFHFWYHSSSNYKLFYTHANGTWGGTLNFLFFTLSGYLLCLRYGKTGRLNLGEFYYKRWKATMPAYLLVFAYPFMTNVFLYGRFFYLDIPKSRLLLTLIGLDGYAHWIAPTYYIVGEWFLGAILIAYACYPLLRILQRRAKWLTLASLTAACIYTWYTGIPGLSYMMNPFACLVCFYVGMLLGEDPQQIETRKAAVITLILSAVVLFGTFLPKLYGSVRNVYYIRTTAEIVTGISLLVCLNYFGERLCARPGLYRIAKNVGDLSYYTFLIHHMIIYMVLGGFDPQSTKVSVLVFGLVVAITLIFSKVLQVVMNALFGSCAYLRFEKYISKGFQQNPHQKGYQK